MPFFLKAGPGKRSSLSKIKENGALQISDNLSWIPNPVKDRVPKRTSHARKESEQISFKLSKEMRCCQGTPGSTVVLPLAIMYAQILAGPVENSLFSWMRFPAVKLCELLNAGKAHSNGPFLRNRLPRLKKSRGIPKIGYPSRCAPPDA